MVRSMYDDVTCSGADRKEHPEIKVGKVNVDEEMVLAQKFMVVSIPTLILFKNGKPEITSVGFKGKEELEEIFKLK